MLADLTAEQRKALIEAATEHWKGWVDAWERGYNDRERQVATDFFLAGVKWALHRENHEIKR